MFHLKVKLRHMVKKYEEITGEETKVEKEREEMKKKR